MYFSKQTQICDSFSQFINKITSNDAQKIFIKTYYPTHIRLVPWLAGGVFAYYLNKMQGRRQKWSTVCAFLILFTI